jgi:hypothetical protein
MKLGNDYHEEVPVSKSIDFFFGIVGSGFFLVLSLVPLLKGDGVRLWSIYICIVLLMLSFLFPRALSPFRKLWIKFGLFIQKITQPLILGILFYVIFAPIGVVLRCFGMDPLLLKRKLGVTSYWKLRDHRQANADMKNQF